MIEITEAITAGVKENLTVHIGPVMDIFDAEGGVTFSMSVKMTPGRNGAVQVETGINYIEKRVRDSNMRVVERKQLPLPGMEKRYKIGGE